MCTFVCSLRVYVFVVIISIMCALLAVTRMNLVAEKRKETSIVTCTWYSTKFACLATTCQWWQLSNLVWWEMKWGCDNEYCQLTFFFIRLVWDDFLTPTIFWPPGQYIVTIYWPHLRYFHFPIKINHKFLFYFLYLGDIKNNASVTVNNDFGVTRDAICQWFSRVT